MAFEVNSGSAGAGAANPSHTGNVAEDPAEKNKRGRLNLVELIRSTICWIGFGAIGWKFPRYLIQNETMILNKRPPYQIISSSNASAETIIVDFELNHPLVQPPTVDDLLLRCTALVLPFMFFVLHAWYNKVNLIYTRSIREYRIGATTTVISAFSAAIGLSEGITIMIKLWVQRRRPNFYDLCGFDPTTKQCTANIKHIREANFSFPSGHSSLVCCGMTFFVWYSLSAMNQQQYQQQQKTTANTLILSSRIKSLIVTCAPLCWTLFVAASRLVDHWHHPSDVIAGLILGFVTSTIAYHNWYPPIWSTDAGIPRSLVLSLSTTRTSNSTIINEDKKYVRINDGDV